MATLTIRKLDDEVHERLKTRAKTNGRSLEAEARHILGERVGSGIDADWIARLRELQRRQEAEYGMLSDSTDVIRRIRDEG